MPIFEYKAIDASGKNVKGLIEADSAKNARLKVKKNGLVITDINEKNAAQKSGNNSNFSFFGNIKLGDISLSTRQLASLVKANIPLVEALTALIDQIENEKLKVVFSTVRSDVNEGSSLAKALSKHQKVFNNVFINMVEAGESSGTLPLVLVRLADFQESQVRLKNKVSSALMYPALMLISSVLLIIGIFVGVIPKIVAVFESMNKPMPIQTRVVIWISDFMVAYWWLIIGAMVFGAIFTNRYINTKNGRRKWDSIVLKLPVVGPLVRMLAVARFSNSMATLLNGGVPILTAMNIVKNIVGNTLIEEAIVQARENVTEGQSIAEPLKRSKQFPPLVIHMVSIGEKTGELPQMLYNVSSSYEEQVSVKIEGLTSLLEPAMIVFMGLVVGGVVASVFVPLIELSNIN
jgi:general secretion pathway protein F